MAGNAKLTAADLAVGDRRTQRVAEELSRAQIAQYAGASGDFNPIHVDEPHATGVAGYPSVMAHGMLTMGLTARLLTDWFGDDVLKDFGVRFLAPVWPGDCLTVEGTVAAIDVDGDTAVVRVEIRTLNQHDAPVVQGDATVALPAKSHHA